jgi:RNA polymerase sigma factor (TIGR02999 family)
VDDLHALLAASRDDAAAQQELEALLHDAARYALRREPGSSLETLDLANEVYLRLARDASRSLADRAHLRRLVSRVTRNVLVDRARRRGTHKRGGGLVQVTYTENELTSAPLQVDVMDLHAALERLRGHDARAADVVELRVFGGATAAEVGEALGLARATVQVEWSFALRWLRRTLSRSG